MQFLNFNSLLLSLKLQHTFFFTYNPKGLFITACTSYLFAISLMVFSRTMPAQYPTIH